MITKPLWCPRIGELSVAFLVVRATVMVEGYRVLLLGGSLTALKVDKFITVVEFQSTGGITTRNAPCDAIAKMQSACRLPSTSSVVRIIRGPNGLLE